MNNLLETLEKNQTVTIVTVPEHCMADTCCP